MSFDIDGQVTISLADMTGKHAAILGKTGSGKTNTGYVWSEEELRAGGLLTIIDPEGDYFHLKNEFPALIIGSARRGNAVDLEVMPDQVVEVASALVSRSVAVICDLSGFDLDAKDAFVSGYLSVLWKQYQFEDMPPQHLLIDEVQLFAPQNGLPDSKKIVQDIASRGRKRGLALIVATQRPQRVDKTVLDATDIRFLHNVQRGAGLKAYDDLLPGTIPNVKDTVPGLARGQAVFMISDTARIIQVRPSATFTPESKTVTVAKVQAVDSALLTDLRALTVKPTAEVSPEVAKLKARIAELETENAALKLAAAAGLPHPLSASERTPSPQTETPEEPIRSDWALKLARGKQERQFDLMLRDLHVFPKHQLKMLRFLVEREGTQYTHRDLARHLGLSQSTIEKVPPTGLIAIGLITRPTRSTHVYASCASEILRQRFPDLELDCLKDKLIASIPVGGRRTL